MPTDKSQQSVCRNTFSFLKAREVRRWLPSRLRPIFPSYTYLFSNQSLKCMEQLALRISNIKLYHIVFQITLFTGLSFQKKNVKDTVIQHNSSFPFLLSISLKRNSRSRIHSEVWLPLEGPGAWQSISLKFIFPEPLLQGHSSVEDPGDSVLWRPSESEVSRPNFPTQDSLPQDPAPRGPGNAHLLCLKLLVSSSVAHNINLMPQKSEKSFPFSEWQRTHMSF